MSEEKRFKLKQITRTPIPELLYSNGLNCELYSNRSWLQWKWQGYSCWSDKPLPKDIRQQFEKSDRKNNFVSEQDGIVYRFYNGLDKPVDFYPYCLFKGSPNLSRNLKYLLNQHDVLNFYFDRLNDLVDKEVSLRQLEPDWNHDKSFISGDNEKDFSNVYKIPRGFRERFYDSSAISLSDKNNTIEINWLKPESTSYYHKIFKLAELVLEKDL